MTFISDIPDPAAWGEIIRTMIVEVRIIPSGNEIQIEYLIQ